MRLPVVLVAVLISGCLLAGPRAEEPALSDDLLETEFTAADKLVFTLDDFTGDAVWFDVVTEDPGTLRLVASLDLPHNGGQGVGTTEVRPALPDICAWAHLGWASSSFVSMQLGAFLRTEQQGQELDIRFDPDDDQVEHTMDVEVIRSSERQVTPVYFMLPGAEAWKEAGGSLTVTVKGEGDLHYRRMPDPAAACVTQPSHFTEGSYSDAGYGRDAEGLAIDFPVSGLHRALFTVSADGAYDYTVLEDGLQVGGDRKPLDGSMAYHGVIRLGEGPTTYRFEVDRLQGTNGGLWLTYAVALVIDVPDAGNAYAP